MMTTYIDSRYTVCVDNEYRRAGSRSRTIRNNNKYRSEEPVRNDNEVRDDNENQRLEQFVITTEYEMSTNSYAREQLVMTT